MKKETPVKGGYCKQHGYYCELYKVKYQLDLFLRGPQVQWKGTCGLHLDKPDCPNLKNGR